MESLTPVLPNTIRLALLRHSPYVQNTVFLNVNSLRFPALLRKRILLPLCRCNITLEVVLNIIAGVITGTRQQFYKLLTLIMIGRFI